MTSPSLSNLEKHLRPLRGIEEFHRAKGKIARLLLALFPDFPRRAIPRSTFRKLTGRGGRGSQSVYDNIAWTFSRLFKFVFQIMKNPEN